MPVYSVRRKSDGEEVTRYVAGTVMSEYGALGEFDHIEYDPENPVQATGPSTMTKLEFLRRFTAPERVAIRTAAAQNAYLFDFMELLNLAEEVNTGDADTIAAVNMIEQSGLIAAGRAEEILNG